VIFASALQGWASLKYDQRGQDLRPLFDAISKTCRCAKTIPTRHCNCSLSLDYSSFVGRIGVGRVARGRIRPASRSQ